MASRLDTRLNKLEGRTPPTMGAWVNIIQEDGESADDFKARISRLDRDGANIIANWLVDPAPRPEAEGQAV